MRNDQQNRFLQQRAGPLALLALAAAAGCTPVVDNGGGNNGNGEPVNVAAPLGAIGAFNLAVGDNTVNTGVIDISASVPTGDVGSVFLTLNASDITARLTDASTSGMPASVNLLFFFSASDAPDPCAGLPAFNQFTIDVSTNGSIRVSPPLATVDSTVVAELQTGQFGLCLGANTTAGVEINVGTIGFVFEPLTPIVANTCSDVLALPAVQDAITVLNNNGLAFTLPRSGTVPDIGGEYVLAQAVTFDPDNQDVGNITSGGVTMSSPVLNQVRRTGLGGAIDLITQGSDSEIAFCVVQDSGSTACDQTIARLENLSRDAASGAMAGNFLAVVVRRNGFTNPACGATGDFIFGDLTLEPPATAALLRARGKVSLNASTDPNLLVLTPDGTRGVVTDFDSAVVRQFVTTTPFTDEAVVAAPGINAIGVSGIGLSADGTLLSLVTDQPDAVTIYDATTFNFLFATTGTSNNYIGARIDFAADNSAVFASQTDERFADLLLILRTASSPFGELVRSFNMPNGRTPLSASLNPAGTVLAILLDSGQGQPRGAESTEASFLTFLDTVPNQLVIPPIDLVTPGGGTVAASQLVFSAGGDRVFLAGRGAVLAVETMTPYTVTPIDVSAGAGDDPVGLALSGDGSALAVAVRDVAGTVNFAVIDPVTLSVVNTQQLNGIDPGGALGIVHLATQPIAVVLNDTTSVVPVRTSAPFSSSSPLTAADMPMLNRLDRIAAGGDVVAVSNIDERAIYLFEPTGR